MKINKRCEHTLYSVHVVIVRRHVVEVVAYCDGGLRVEIEVNAGGGGAYPPPRVEIELNKDGGGLYPPPRVEIEAMRVEERRTLLLGSKSR
jgi:hypothetical protein